MRRLFLSAIIMLAGCVVDQPMVVQSACTGFVIGKTTRAEVLNKCGLPKTHYEGTEGSALLYENSGRIQNFGFDANGVLNSTSGS
jgi:hypothetical protein